MAQSSLANSRGANGHGLGNVEGDSGAASDGLLLQCVALTLGETSKFAVILQSGSG